jgi:pilus assembly protein CpaF
VQITRLVDGSRRISHVTEVLRMESDVITLQDIFLARPPDEEAAGAQVTRLLSPLSCTGLKPHFLEKMAASGVALPSSFFQQEDPNFRPSFTAASYGGFK